MSPKNLDEALRQLINDYPTLQKSFYSFSFKFRRFLYQQLLKIKNLPPPDTDFPTNLYPKIRLYFILGNLARDFDYSQTVRYYLIAMETLEETGLFPNWSEWGRRVLKYMHSQEFMRF